MSGPSGPARGGTTQLRRGWSALARLVWLALIAAQVVIFITTMPAYMSGAAHTCAQSCDFTPQQAQLLHAVGIPLTTYIWVTAALFAVVVLVAVLLALILFWRRSDDWMVLAIGYFVVSYPLGVFAAATPVNAFAAPTLLQVLTLPGIVIPYAVFLVFPTGRFVPRWTWVLLLAWVLWYVPVHVQPQWLNGPLVLGYPVFYGAIIASQVYRYRRVSTPVEREQTKWVALSLVATLVANQLFWQSTYTPLLFTFAAFLVYQLSLLFLPVAFFVAVQRYRLYDIDRLINKALVYGSLTAILGGVYALGVVGTQHLVTAVAGRVTGESPAIIVATTLLVAALFQPLRRRLQAVIDYRFYRRKYNAATTLADFASTLREELDLPTLEGELTRVVRDTMQPAHITLWVRQPESQATLGRGPER